MILPCYIHSIYIFCIIYRLWRWHFFFNYFLFARSKIQNWRKNGPIWRKIQKKVELHGFHGVCFFQVCQNPSDIFLRPSNTLPGPSDTFLRPYDTFTKQLKCWLAFRETTRCGSLHEPFSSSCRGLLTLAEAFYAVFAHFGQFLFSLVT